MKKVMFLCMLSIFLFACGGAPATPIPPSPTPTLISPTSTPLPIPTATSVPLPTPTPAITPSPILMPPTNTPTSEITWNCKGDLFNCGDFSSCEEAMSYFLACPGDPSQLDKDGDGIPCETLCQ